MRLEGNIMLNYVATTPGFTNREPRSLTSSESSSNEGFPLCAGIAINASNSDIESVSKIFIHVHGIRNTTSGIFTMCKP